VGAFSFCAGWVHADKVRRTGVDVEEGIASDERRVTAVRDARRKLRQRAALWW